MYRPPNCKVEFNDRFENFIDDVLRHEKNVILIGDFNKNLIDEETDTEWSNFTTSLGLSQLINSPTRIIETSCPFIDYLIRIWKKNTYAN